MKRFFIAASIMLLSGFALPSAAAEYGVYVQVVEKADGVFDEIVDRCGQAFEEKGWQVISSYEASIPGDCGFKAHTMVLHNAGYARKILAKGPRAAFALPLRAMVWQDEKGTHAGYVNPASLNRTVLGEGAVDAISTETAAELSGIIAGAAGGTRVDRQIGQLRDKGRIGGMGGGDFEKKVEVVYEADAPGPEAIARTAEKVKEGVQADTSGWKLSYHLDCIPQGVAIIGVTKGPTEARAYGIAGEKRESKANSCPGIDHAAAFPIEVVVMQEGEKVKVAVLDEMYRMKVYFEDAGNWAFMKNMTMPGQIEEEVVKMSLSRLKQ